MKAYVSNIAVKSPGIIAKLRIVPSQAGVKRLNSHRAVLAHASDLVAEGKEIIAIEAKVEDGYKAEADIIVKDKDGKMTYIDVTTTNSPEIMSLKLHKAEAISLEESIDYVVHKVNNVDPISLDYKCKFTGPSSNMFYILEKTASTNLDTYVVKKRVNQLFSTIIKDVSLTKIHTVDKRWASVPIEFVQMNSPLAVSETLKIVADKIPEMTKFVAKLNTCAKMSKKPIFYLLPASTDLNEIHPFIKAIKSIPKVADAYFIKDDYSIDVADTMVQGNFVTDNSILALVRRRYEKTSKTYYENRYIIKFNASYIGPDMSSAITRTTNKNKSSEYSSSMFKDLTESKDDHISKVLSQFEEVSELLCMSSGVNDANLADVFVKMITISATDVGVLDADSSSILTTTRELIAKCIAAVRDTIAGQIISHYHEVARTVAASIGKSARRHEYFVGRNGAYNSYTLVKCTGSQDSFKCAPYKVFYKPMPMLPTLSNYVSSAKAEGDFLVTNRRTATKNVINWHIKLPYVFINLISWHIEQRTTVFQDMVTPPNDYISSSFIYSIINRDPFAQVADLTRYWYGSSIGDDADILGLIKKYDTYIVKYFTEVVYIARQIKMAAALRSYKCQNLTKYDVKDSQGSMAIALCMPHLNTITTENSAVISMFYISNVFNKYKYNAEVSAAICYLTLKEELEIYEASDVEYKRGISDNNKDITCLQDILNDDVKFNDELNFIKRLMARGSNRFQCSILATYLFSLKFGPTVDLDSLYIKLAEAPIDALTMRGGMDSLELGENSQSIRAASTMIEGIIDAYGESSSEFNSNVYSKNVIMSKLKNADVSILALKNLQFAQDKLLAYRVVHKDQKGHREISVLNYNMRIATYFLEHIFKFLSKGDDTDLLQNPDKLRVVQSYIRGLDYRRNKVTFDTTDQTRWGPNVLLHQFAAMTTAVLDIDTGLVRLTLDSLEAMTKKKAKIPDALMALLHAEHIKFNPLSAVGKCMNLVTTMISEKRYALDMAPGMGQGILHQVSSTLHVIKRKATAYLLGQIVPSVIVKDNTTSDDNTTIITLPKGIVIDLDDPSGESKTKLSVEHIYLTINRSLDNIFNIIRNTSKSFLSRRLMDFNSSFYTEECLAVPTLKQRIAYIDCGEGEDMLSDMVSAAAIGSSYLLAGGSYLGSMFLSITNMSIVMDQHRAWFKYKADARPMSERSVFAMGLPLIEPLSTLMYGPLTSVVLREIKATGLSAKVILTALLNNVTAPSASVSQQDLIRGDSMRHVKEEFKYLIPSNISGLIALFRPQKLQSRFIRRHKFNSIPIDEELVHYRKTYPGFTNFIFTASIGIGTKLKEDNLGINNFLIRYTEPWISIASKKFIVANTKVAAALYKGTHLSLKGYEEICSKLTNEEIIKVYTETAKTAENDLSEVLVNVLTEFMEPARAILDLISTHDVKPVISNTTYSHVKVLLPHKLVGESNDVRKSMIRKIYSGKNTIFFNKSEDITFGPLLENKLKAMRTDSLKDAILTADLLYNSVMKYARVKTVGTAKSKDDVVKYENIAVIYLGKMFTSTVSIDIRFKLDKLSAPLSYVSMNKSVQDRLLKNRDNYSSMIVHNVLSLEAREIFEEVYIKAERPIVQNCQSIVDFVKYQTATKFKLNSETIKSFSEELLSLAGFAGDIVMTKTFIKSVASGMLSSTTFSDCNGIKTKVIVPMKEAITTKEGFPLLLINELTVEGYITTALIFAPDGIDSARLYIDISNTKLKAWEKNLFLALSTEVKDAQIKLLSRVKAPVKDILRIKFISEATCFKLNTHSATGNFFLTDGDITIPLRTNLIYNRKVIKEELSKFVWPSITTLKDPAIKVFANVTSDLLPLLNTTDITVLKALVSSMNSLNFPVDESGIVMLLNTKLIEDTEIITLGVIADDSNARATILKYPDIFVAFLIVALKAVFNIGVRKSTLVRTLLKPIRSSADAPLFFLSDETIRTVDSKQLRVIKSTSELPSIDEIFPESEIIGLTEEDITDEERAFEEEFKLLMQKELEAAAAKREQKVIVEPASEATGTVFSEEFYDYKQMSGEVAETETTFDTMLVSSNNAIEAVLEEAKHIAESLILRDTKPGYKIFNVLQFSVAKRGYFESTLLSLLMNVPTVIAATSFVFLLLT
jgi:hypothetical protein